MRRTRIYPERVGDTVQFNGVGPHFYQDIIDNGKKLTVGGIYTVSYFREYGSWTEIRLAETGDVRYNHTWFDKV